MAVSAHSASIRKSFVISSLNVAFWGEVHPVTCALGPACARQSVRDASSGWRGPGRTRSAGPRGLTRAPVSQQGSDPAIRPVLPPCVASRPRPSLTRTQMPQKEGGEARWRLGGGWRALQTRAAVRQPRDLRTPPTCLRPSEVRLPEDAEQEVLAGGLESSLSPRHNVQQRAEMSRQAEKDKSFEVCAVTHVICPLPRQGPFAGCARPCRWQSQRLGFPVRPPGACPLAVDAGIHPQPQARGLPETRMPPGRAEPPRFLLPLPPRPGALSRGRGLPSRAAAGPACPGSGALSRPPSPLPAARLLPLRASPPQRLAASPLEPTRPAGWAPDPWDTPSSPSAQAHLCRSLPGANLSSLPPGTACPCNTASGLLQTCGSLGTRRPRAWSAGLGAFPPRRPPLPPPAPGKPSRPALSPRGSLALSVPISPSVCVRATVLSCLPLGIPQSRCLWVSVGLAASVCLDLCKRPHPPGQTVSCACLCCPPHRALLSDRPLQRGPRAPRPAGNRASEQ